MRKLHFCILFEVFVVYCFPRFATFEFQLQWFFHFQMCRPQKKDRNIPSRYTTSISVSDNHYILFFQPFALAQNFWSNYFFYICCHAGGSTKHLRRSKVKRRKEESSPWPQLQRKEKLVWRVKQRYIYSRTVNFHLPPPNPIFLPPAFAK